MSQKMNPFPGLRPFEMQEKYLFFGREDQTVELLKRLGQARFLAVVGTSGSGKSSLVRAGLLPELHGGTMTDAGSSWEISVMRPGGDPLTNLARALEDSGIYDSDEEDYYRHLRAMLGRSTMGLIEAVAQSKIKKEANLLIVVDQFEEIFRFRSDNANHAEEAASFINLLLEAAEQTEKSIFVIITMRSDFLGDCSQFRGLAEAVNEGEYLIPRLNRNQRRLAIEGPVKVGGKQIEARLVQQLLNDIGDDPDQLPILQHALMRTWEYHEKGEGQGNLDLEHYEATGGMQEALSRHADEVYDELPTDEDRKYCEKIFKALTERVSEGRGIRHPMAMGELAEVVGVDDPRKLVPIVEAYRAAGRTFLMPPDSIELGPKVVVDISHESLMRVWGHLVNWVDEEAQSARIYRRLADTSLLFKENKAGLYRDPDLQISLAWRDQNNPTEAWADRYYPGFIGAMAFLEQSHETSIAEEKAREEARKRELEQARRLASEERKSRALWQKLVWTFGVAVVAITVGLFYIMDSRATIRDNLSRVSLKEANRLANNNQQDEAIALLANTIEDNPSYSAASVRLLSMLEHTAFPSSIEKIHSMDDEFKAGSNASSILVYAEHNLYRDRGIREDSRKRYRLFNLDSGELIEDWASENPLTFGQVTENGKYFSYIEEDEGGNAKFFFYDIESGNTSDFEILRDVRYTRMSDNGENMAVYFTDGGFSIYSVGQAKAIFEYDPIAGGLPINITMSPDGEKVAMATDRSDRVDVTIFDHLKGERRLLKTYPVTHNDVDISFTDDAKSLILISSGRRRRELGVSRSCELVDLESGASVDLRPDSDGYWGEVEFFLNKSLVLAREAEGDLAMSRYPFGNFTRMQGHNGVVSSTSMSNDGMMLATGSEDRTVRLWSTASAEQISAPIRFDDAIINVAFAPDDKAMYVAVVGGDLYKVNLPLRKAEQVSYELGWESGSSVVYDQDLDMLATLNSEAFSVLDFKDQKPFSIPVEEAGAVRSRRGGRSYSFRINWEQKETFFLGTIQQTNLVLNIGNFNERVIKEKYKLPPGTRRAHLDSLGERLAMVSTNNIVSLIDVRSKKLIGESFLMDQRFSTATITGDEDLMYGGSGWRGIQFYDISSGVEVGSLIDLRSAYVDFLPATKKYVVVSGYSSIVYIFGDRLDSEIILDSGQIYQSHGVNKEESLIAVATEDGDVTIWNIDNGEKVGDALKHDVEAEGVVFHPHNDQYVFTFTDGGFVYGWDRKEGNVFMGPVRLFPGRGLYINSEGTVLSAIGYNGRVYRVPVQIPETGYDYSTWLPGLASSVVGFRINDSGTYEDISLEESQKLREESKGSVTNESMANWIAWLTDGSSTAKAAPVGDTTRDEIVKNLANSGTLLDFQKALQLSPSDPNLLSGYAQQMLTTLGAGEEYKRQATYFIAKARELGVGNSFVFFRSAQIEEMFDNQADALRYIDRALELDPGNAEYSEFKKSLLQNN